MGREEKNLAAFLKAPPDKWVESCYEVDGPLYMGALAAHIWGPDKWRQHRTALLQRLLVTAHVRAVAPAATTRLVGLLVVLYPCNM